MLCQLFLEPTITIRYLWGNTSFQINLWYILKHFCTFLMITKQELHIYRIHSSPSLKWFQLTKIQYNRRMALGEAVPRQNIDLDFPFYIRVCKWRLGEWTTNAIKYTLLNEWIKLLYRTVYNEEFRLHHRLYTWCKYNI